MENNALENCLITVRIFKGVPRNWTQCVIRGNEVQRILVNGQISNHQFLDKIKDIINANLGELQLNNPVETADLGNVQYEGTRVLSGTIFFSRPILDDGSPLRSVVYSLCHAQLSSTIDIHLPIGLFSGGRRRSRMIRKRMSRKRKYNL